MGEEQDRAQMGASRNEAEDAYFAARPKIDSGDRIDIFDAGFEHAWAARQVEIDRLRNQVELGQKVVSLGVELMTTEQVGKWVGVRHFQEATLEMYTPFVETPNVDLTGADRHPG